MIPALPEGLLPLLERQYGEQTAARIVEGYGHRRPVTLRINPLKADREEALTQLRQVSPALKQVSWYADAFILPDCREDAVEALPVYQAGGVYLQSLSAMLPALLLQPEKGKTVLDMAAAPGGKTTQIAALTENKALITACERDAIRAERLKHNLQLQGAGRVSVMVQDARRLDDFFSFDTILLDAPCSGSGTILLTEGEKQRRMDPGWLKKTADTQAAMLRKALKLLRPGGEMVYSTCSILEMENEGVLRRVLPEFRAQVVPMQVPGTEIPLLPVTMQETLCVCPTELYEGFFVARIRKPKK